MKHLKCVPKDIVGRVLEKIALSRDSDESPESGQGFDCARCPRGIIVDCSWAEENSGSEVFGVDQVSRPGARQSGRQVKT